MRRIGLVLAAVVVAVLLALLAWQSRTRQATRPGEPTAPAARAPEREPAPGQARLPAIHLPGGEASAAPEARAGAFEGRVVSTATGRGLRATLTFLHGGAALTVSADDAGAFRFAPPGPGRYELASAVADGHAPLEPPHGASPVAFEARPGRRLSGVTLYLEPLRALRVEVHAPDGTPLAGAGVGVAGEPRRVRTGLDGAATIQAADGATVEAEHPRHRPGRAVVDFRARASGRLVVTLRPGGGPGAGAISGVVAQPDGHDRAVIVTSGDAEALAGPDGRFTLSGLDDGEHELVARARGLLPASARARTGATGVRLVLRPGAALTGVVRDAQTGEPLPAFTVIASPRVGAVERGEAVSASVYDAEGRYRLEGLRPGRWVVSAAALGYAPSEEHPVEIGEGVAEADLALGRGGRLHGRVRDRATASPLAGARVDLEGVLAARDAPVPVLASTTTDETGAFSLAGVAPGLRSIFVSAERHHARILSGLRVEPGQDLGPLTVALSPTEGDEEPTIELAGINAVLRAEGDVLVIGGVMPGGGAAEAGLLVGDQILRVDGAPVAQLGFDGAVQRIRGPEGSQVLLGVRRAGGAEADVPVTRKLVRPK